MLFPRAIFFLTKEKSDYLIYGHEKFIICLQILPNALDENCSVRLSTFCTKTYIFNSVHTKRFCNNNRQVLKAKIFESHKIKQKSFMSRSYIYKIW